MNNLLLVLFLAGCTAQASDKVPDAGALTPKNNVYVENRIRYVTTKYYPVCVRQCFRNTSSRECPVKCLKDFEQIQKVLIRAIRDNKEDDFDDMMDSWYGQE